MADEMTKSVNELSGLAAAIQVFERRFQDLQNHLHFIQSTIDAKFYRCTAPEQLELSTPTSYQTQIPPTEIPPTDTMTTKKIMSPPQPSPRSELHSLCKKMSSRGLRKYVVTHLSDSQSLRRDATSALKLAPNPAKLVLECVGRFFSQGRKAYSMGSPMISSREASVLFLEFFLRLIAERSGKSEVEIEKSVKQEADKNAIAWWKRLIREGGLQKACEIDARGLLMFIACFGIPKDFENDDVRDLIRSSNLTEIGDLLKGSRSLVARIPDIVESMTKKGMYIEAVEIVYNFGIEDKFSPRKLLNSFLQASKEAWRRNKLDAPLPLKDANEKHLASLKSVITCLEDRKIDAAKLLPEWQIKEQIVKLEKDIAEMNKQLTDNNVMPKRKMGDIDSSNKLNSKEAKRSRFMANGSSLMSSPNVIRSHDPRPANYADRKSSHDCLMPNLLDGGFSGFVNGQFAAADSSHGCSAGPVPDCLGTAVQGGGGVHAGADEVGMSASSVVLLTSSFSGTREEVLIGKSALRMYDNASPYGWQRVRDAAYDRVIGQSSVGQPVAVGVYGIDKPSSHFPGLLDPPSISAGSQKSSSDLYSFADAVV